MPTVILDPFDTIIDARKEQAKFLLYVTGIALVSIIIAAGIAWIILWL